MSTHPILIRNHLQAGDGPRELLLVHQGRVMPVAPALLCAGPFCDDGKGGLIAPASTLDGGAGYIDAHGRWLVAPDLEKTHPFHDGLSGFRKDGLLGYMNLDGSMAIAPRWTGGQHFSDGLTAVLVAPDTWRYIDKRGEFAFDGEFCEAGQFRAHGLAPARIGKRDLAGYLDKQGGWAIAPRFLKALHFCADGAAPAAVAENEYGLIDASGAWIVQPHYRYIKGFNADGLAFFGRGKDSWDHATGFLDARGQISFRGARYEGDTMVDGWIRESDHAYASRHGKVYVPGMDWCGELDKQGLAVGRTAHAGEEERAGGQPDGAASWGILDMDGEFVTAPANALEPLTERDGMLMARESGTPLTVFIGNDDDLLMLDREACIAYRLRRESCADGQYAALYDAGARLLWRSDTGVPVAVPAPFFVAPAQTLMDQLSSPDALIDFAKAMLLDTERKLHLLAREGLVDDDEDEENDDDDEDEDDEYEDDDVALAGHLTTRRRIARFYLNEELVGYYGFLAEERGRLLARIRQDCVERLSALFGAAGHAPDFANQPEQAWFHAWAVSLDTALPGADGTPEANRLWLALNASGDTGDGDEWGDLWLTCAPSLDTLDLVLDAFASLPDEDEEEEEEEEEDEEDEEQAGEHQDDPALMSHDALVTLLAHSPQAIRRLRRSQITADMADAAIGADGAALSDLPAHLQTPARLETVIRKDVLAARQVPVTCMSAQGLALARALYGEDRHWIEHDKDRSRLPKRWDQNCLSSCWGALLDAQTSERALRAGASLRTIPLWLRTPELQALALELDLSNIRDVDARMITPALAGRAVLQRYAKLLGAIPDHLLTPALCLSAVETNGESLQYVPLALRSVALCAAAMRSTIYCLEWVPQPLRDDVGSALIDAAVAAAREEHGAAPDGTSWHSVRAWTRLCAGDFDGAIADASASLPYLDYPEEAHFILASAWRGLGQALPSALEAATVLALCEEYFPRFDQDADVSWLSREARATLSGVDPEALLRGLQTHPLALSRVPRRRITAAMAKTAVAASPDALEFVPDKLMTAELEALAAR